MVPEPEFESYYGKQIIKTPTWKTPDVPLYLFLGGLAGASAVLAEGAAATGNAELERVGRVAAAGGAAVGTVFLVHDLGRPERFLNMLRVFKVTSPLSVGSFILAPFSALSSAALASHLTGRLPLLGRAAGLGAALFGPPLATYTAALLANTAVPAWHDAHRELPFVFGGSGASAAGGLALLRRAGLQQRAGPADGDRRGGGGADLLGAAQAAAGHDRRALRAGPSRAADEGRVEDHRGRRGRLRAGPALADGVRGLRGRARHGLGDHPVRRLRGRAGFG